VIQIFKSQLKKEKIMSILSNILKKAAGVPEVNLNKLPFANKIVGEWESKSMEDLVKQLPKETIHRLIDVCNNELKTRS
jgi:glutamyl-tRNA reductase